MKVFLFFFFHPKVSWITSVAKELSNEHTKSRDPTTMCSSTKKGILGILLPFHEKKNPTANNTAKKHTESMEKANQKPKQTITAYILTKTFHQDKNHVFL